LDHVINATLKGNLTVEINIFSPMKDSPDKFIYCMVGSSCRRPEDRFAFLLLPKTEKQLSFTVQLFILFF